MKILIVIVFYLGAYSTCLSMNSDSKKLTVVVFMGTECPLSINYTLTLNKLHQQYFKQGVEIIGVFSFEDDDDEKIKAFSKQYDIKFIVERDILYHFADSMKATITPEAFLLNTKGEVLYSGKIDNWPITLGKRRTVITEYYLQDAIESYLNDRPILNKKTEAVGCYIHAHMSHGN